MLASLDNNACRATAFEALPELVMSFGYEAAKAARWLRRHGPSDGPSFEAIEAACEARAAPKYNQHKFAKRIGVTAAMRRELGLTLIGASDKNKRKITRERAEASVVRAKQWRADKANREGRRYTPRSASKAARARAAGISLSTFQRRARDTVSNAADDTVSNAAALKSPRALGLFTNPRLPEEAEGSEAATLPDSPPEPAPGEEGKPSHTTALPSLPTSPIQSSRATAGTRGRARTHDDDAPPRTAAALAA